MLGWSLGGMSGPGEGRPLEDMVSYPCVFRFKAIARHDDDLVQDLLTLVQGVLGEQVKDDAWSVRDSQNGRYVCLTVDAFVTSGEQVYAIYDALKTDTRVTHLL